MTSSIQRERRRGASLPTVMMMVALMFTLAFTVVAIAFNHLNLSFRSTNNSKAEHLAEAVLALAIEKAYDPNQINDFGITKDETLTLSFPSYPDGNIGVLSFDRAQAASLGVPYSTNNRSDRPDEDLSHDGWVIPGQSLHLVARAEVGGAFSTMEAVVQVPKFPYSIASGGRITSEGGLLVASVRPGKTYDLSLPIHEEDLEPGNLVSNWQSQGEVAISLTEDDTIMGDVRSSSEVSRKPGTKIFGTIRTNAEQVELPKLNASSYDPRSNGADGPPRGQAPEDRDFQSVETSVVGELSVKGYNTRDGNLSVENTGINLNGGVLYVDGDLTVRGGVRGKGAIIATGNITIDGGGEATTDNQAALIADGNIVLRGTPSEKAKFAGLIYTNGNLRAENMRLAGVFVASGGQEDAAGNATTASDVNLVNTELYQVNELAELQLDDEFRVPDTLYANSSTFNDTTNGIELPLTTTYDPAVLQANLSNYINPNTGPNEPAYLFKTKVGTNYMTVRKVAGVNTMVATTGPDQYVLDGASLGMVFCGVRVHSEAEAVSVAMSKAEELYAAAGKTMSSQNRSSITTMAGTAYNSLAAGFQMGVGSIVYTESQSGPGGGAVGSAFNWKIDLSSFISESERMRVRYWSRFR